MNDVIDAATGELVPADTGTLFRTDDPVQVLEAARTVAAALNTVLEDGKMTTRIGGREHVNVEGWQTLGSMLGVIPYPVWSRPLPDGAGWEARAEARTLDGRIVGAGESMCTRQERNWRNRDDFALRSMAQTRAISRALSAPLRFVVTMGGRSGTPAEEIDTPALPYGPEAAPKQVGRAGDAIRAIHGDGYDAAGLLEKIVDDADGYLPQIVCRALIRMAAHRPGRQDAGPVTQSITPEQDTPETAETTAEQHREADIRFRRGEYGQ